MGRYIDADKLIAEIRKLRSESCISESDDYYEYAKSEIIDIITALQQEQPEVDLGAEIEKELRLHYNDDQDVYWWNYLKNSFRYFYELGKNSK